MPEIACIIVEDEPLAIKVLSDYIAEIPFLRLAATFRDAILATEYLRDHSIDLIFLDIHLPKLKGIAFLKTLQHPPAVIITTAYNQYAIEGFELNVTDYLLKPIGFERFLVAVTKVKTAVREKQEQVEKPGTKDYLFLNVQKKKVKVSFADILYIESQREYIRIVTTKKEYVSKLGTHEIESLLPANQFVRVHRSFIVSITKIDSFTAEELEVNGAAIPIGRGYRDVIERL